MNIRDKNWSYSENKNFDVVVIGGGINGASVYRKLCAQGYSVLLLDKGDFSSGSSQTSAMMIWGGLLYLRNFDIFTVRSFSKDRDALIDAYGNQIMSRNLRYILNSGGVQNKYLINLALQLYWLLGTGKRRRPAFQKKFDESIFINGAHDKGSFIYEEGFLRQSDNRFVLNWIISCQSDESFALNYCELREGYYNHKDKLWSLNLCDLMSNKQCTVKAKILINCAGVWTDSVNEQFNIRTPYKHVFSKGVFLGFARPEKHHLPLIFEMGEHGDVLTFIPWGPISLWGPTETMVHSIEEGFTTMSADIDFLMKHASKNLKPAISNSSIVSLRCGIRPLVVDKNFTADCYPLSLSRRFKIVEDPCLPWFSIYGGKISGCLSLSEKVVFKISCKISPTGKKRASFGSHVQQVRWSHFPGVNEEVPAIDWCVENEFCCTLEDYLRRRTNISQWIPREGLGHNDEYKGLLAEMAQHMQVHVSGTSCNHVQEYVKKVHEGFDNLINNM